jgi:hypothetical protein
VDKPDVGRINVAALPGTWILMPASESDEVRVLVILRYCVSKSRDSSPGTASANWATLKDSTVEASRAEALFDEVLLRAPAATTLLAAAMRDVAVSGVTPSDAEDVAMLSNAERVLF